MSDSNAELVRTLLIQGGYMPSLARRFVRLDEVPEWLWRGDADKMKMYSEQVFKKERTMLVHEGKTLSWEEFERDVLPTAIGLHFVPINRLYDIGCLTTTMDANAKPITIYDKAEQRNPFTTWIAQQMKHHRGSAPYKWKINLDQEHEVHAITYPSYSFFSDERKQDLIRLMVFGNAMLVHGQKGLGIFKSELIEELQPVWPDIERFSLNTPLANPRDAFVCMANSTHLEFEFIVTTEEKRIRYFVDRYRANDPSMSALEKTRAQERERLARQQADGA
jgi:hypothetical protein